MTSHLSDAEIDARLDALRAQVEPPAVPRRYVVPLVEAADEYIRWAQRPAERVYLGIREFDDAMRGVAPGELCLVVGYAHSGKTLLTTQVTLANRERRIALWTPDETRVLVVTKLASVVHGVSAEELEYRLRDRDPDAVAMLRSTATEHFPHLVVFDQVRTLQEMTRSLEEARDAWGAKEDLSVWDYADLLDDAGDDVKGKIDAFKAWGKDERTPLILLHQSSRTAGRDGQQVTMSSGAFGGEQQATFVIGVRRRRDELVARIRELREKLRVQSSGGDRIAQALAEAQDDLARYENTLTISLVKNKRPPSKLVGDTDFLIDPRTGRLHPFDFATAASVGRASEAKVSPLPSTILVGRRGHLPSAA